MWVRWRLSPFCAMNPLKASATSVPDVHRPSAISPLIQAVLLNIGAQTISSEEEVNVPVPLDALIPIGDVAVLTSLSESAIYQKVKPDNAGFDPTFPPIVKLGYRSAWSLRRVLGWIGAAVKAADEKAPTDRARQ